jgi:hypothetical protein
LKDHGSNKIANIFITVLGIDHKIAVLCSTVDPIGFRSFQKSVFKEFSKIFGSFQEIPEFLKMFSQYSTMLPPFVLFRNCFSFLLNVVVCSAMIINSIRQCRKKNMYKEAQADPPLLLPQLDSLVLSSAIEHTIIHLLPFLFPPLFWWGGLIYVYFY